MPIINASHWRNLNINMIAAYKYKVYGWTVVRLLDRTLIMVNWSLEFFSLHNHFYQQEWSRPPDILALPACILGTVKAIQTVILSDRL
jgi:hypothetical protein